MIFRSILNNSVLSEASYASFSDIDITNPSVIVTALKNDGFSPTQAADFVSDWDVIDHQPDTLSGFSATLFERKDATGKGTGEFTFAIRGTQGFVDIDEDIYSLAAQGIAREQAVDLYRYYKRLITDEGRSVTYSTQELLMLTALESGSFNPLTTTLSFLSVVAQTSNDTGLGKLKEDTKVDVTGHSLGGHLAMLFSQMFPQSTEQVTTYNGAGLGGIASELLDLAGFDGAVPASQVTNIVADQGIDMTAGIGFVIGDTDRIFIESGSGIHNHSISGMVDSLAVYSLLSSIDPSADLSSTSHILEAASIVPEDSLETTVQDIAELFSVVITRPIDSREKLHQSLQSIENELFVDRTATSPVLSPEYQNLQIIDLSSYTRQQLVTDANSQIAIRYALIHLDPFAVTGNDNLFTPHNQNGELDLYNEATRTGTLTQSYLDDRAHFLTLLNARNLTDASVKGETIEFFDMTSGEIAHYDNASGGDRRRIQFGSDSNDLLEGGENTDHLYGGNNDDTLIGNGGADHLEGGKGDDTYIAGDGDTILDTDGFGRIVFDDRVLFGGNRHANDAEGVFNSSDGAITYKLEGQSLLISYQSSNLVIDQFQDLDLGIHLEESRDLEEPTKAIHGTNDNDNGLDDNTQPLSGSLDSDYIHGYTGQDILNGKHGDDLLIGGADTDILIGGFGNDLLHAGVESDMQSIEGGHGFLLTGDALSGQPGDDLLYGSHGNDYLAGGGDKDVIYAGAGDDFILGDSDRVVGSLDWIHEDGGIIYADGGIVHTSDPTVAIIFKELLSVPNPINADNDLVYAGDGNDTAMGQAGNDVIYGEGGDDILDGDLEGTGLSDLPGQYHGDDFIDGGSGDDGIRGQGGNDILYGGEGADWIEGDSRFDFSLYEQLDTDYQDDSVPADWSDLDGTSMSSDPNYHGNDFLHGGAGDDNLFGQGKGDVLLGGEGDDRLIGDLNGLDIIYHGSDILDGGNGNDELIGYGKDDKLYGGNGDDELDGDSGDLPAEYHGDDILSGGAGADTLIGNGGNDWLEGDEDDDILYGDAGDIDVQYHGNDSLYGGDGSDTLVGSGGADILFGDTGNDALYGDSNDIGSQHHGDDSLNGGAGDDLLFGYGGNDRLSGGADNDQLYGDSSSTTGQYQGNDTLDGGDGDDLLVGSGGSDLLIGGAGNDQLSGDSSTTLIEFQANDTLYGGAGNDVLVGHGGNDNISGDDGDDEASGDAGDDILDGGAGNDKLFGGEGNDTIEGGDGDDKVYGNEGNDNLKGGFGDDLVSGGDGSDIILGNAGNDQLGGGEGNDLIEGDIGIDTLYGHAGDDELSGGADNDFLSGGDGNDLLAGGDGIDILNGGSGIDILRGGEGEDLYLYNIGDGEVRIEDQLNNTLRFGLGISLNTITLGLGSLKVSTGVVGDEVHIAGFDPDNPYQASGITRYEFINGAAFSHQDLISMIGFDFDGTEGDDKLIGTNASDKLNGYGGNDILIGKDADDIMDGGEGIDNMSGGAGDDYYVVDDNGDTLVEKLDEGIDTVNSTISFILPEHIENLHLAGLVNINGTGNGLNNILIGNNSGNNLQGMSGDDQLNGKNGADILDGGAGADTLSGGAGDDIYYIDNDGDNIVEYRNNGHDVVFSIVTETLTNNIEDLILSGSMAIDGSGNDDANILIGNSANNRLFGAGGNDLLEGRDGNDILDGGLGADQLYGGRGDDHYLIESASDTVRENDGEGSDTVEAQINYSLGVNIENLVLSGYDAINGVGNALDNTIIGNANNNRIDGGAGADRLVGNAGNDHYIVDNSGDRVIEYAREGYDRIESNIDIDLSENIEELILTGSAIAGIGNSLSNIIKGNENSNRLEGGEGHDSIYGQGGNDLISGGEGLDKLYGENGDDTIYGGNFADELFGGAGNDKIMGDEGDDLLIGGSGTDNLTGGTGADYLDGGDGVDVMSGGQGDDAYQVDHHVDVVIEKNAEGVDRVYSITSYVLGAHVEELYLQGNLAIDGYGNAEDNRIVGNSADNILSGESGDDVLFGSYGHNQLYGGSGNDILDGQQGHSDLYGGVGNDHYIIDSDTDLVSEGQNSGYDRVESSVSYTLVENVEALQLVGDTDLSASGNALDNNLLGNDADNQLSGQAGDDYIDGSAGNDWLEGDIGDDILYGGDDGTQEINIGYGGQYYGGSILQQLIPNNDYLHGGIGNDHLDGGSGNDSLHGGSGNDVLYGGDDGERIYSDSYYGGPYITSLSNDDYLNGGEGNDVLDGGTGSDELYGGAGQDELAGGEGADLLDGGEAIDVMAGGAGDDIYHVDGYAETILIPVEGTDEPNDDESNSCTCDGISKDDEEDEDNEDEFAKGNEGIGNGEDPPPWGHDDNWNDGVGTSPGRPGSKYKGKRKYKDDEKTYYQYDEIDVECETDIETPYGSTHTEGETDTSGAADYEIQTQYMEEIQYYSDSVIEKAGEGYDVVYTSITYVLTNHVEELHLTGTEAMDGTGNALDNRIYGNSADNVLDGGVGTDILQGGLGNDTYVIDSQYDVINETETGGEDTVISSVSYQLLNVLENLVLSGTAEINATGNQGDNSITGNEADNTIMGGQGNDTLHGGQGNDLLDGGEGDDHYLYQLGEGLDTITDTAGLDRVVFGDDIYLESVAGRIEYQNGVRTAHLRILDQYGTEQFNQGLDIVLDPQDYTATIESFVFADGSVHAFDELLIHSLEHDGTKRRDKLSYNRDDDVAWLGRGDDFASGGTGNDILLGEDGEDILSGQGGIDLLFGGEDEDSLYGGGGNDLLFGGDDEDQLVGCQGNDLYVGGRGGDSLYLQCGDNVVLYSQGDGEDKIHLDENVSSVSLSLGTRITLDQLSLEKDDEDLILHILDGEDHTCIVYDDDKEYKHKDKTDSAIVFDDWYEDVSGNERPTLTLQIISDAQADFDDNSADSLGKPQIHQYDLGAIIQAFDTARDASDIHDSWSLTHAALEEILLATSDEAIGGQLSYGYAMNSNIDVLGNTAFNTLNDPRFAVSNQSLHMESK